MSMSPHQSDYGEPMSNRFDYVKYDDKAIADQAQIKEAFIVLEELIVKKLRPSRPGHLVITKLEEAYMWVGKAIRDEQLVRTQALTQEPAPAQEDPPRQDS